MKILLLSETPVAGAFNNAAHAVIQNTNHDVKAFTLNAPKKYNLPIDFGPLRLIPGWKEILVEAVKEADLIVIHNMQADQYLSLVFDEKDKNCITIYQNHSPPLEGPQYFYSALRKYPFDLKISIGQGHGRFFDFDALVPNIIGDPNINPRPWTHRQPWIFTPSISLGRGRWSQKLTPKDFDLIKSAAQLSGLVKCVSIRDITNQNFLPYSQTQLLMQNSQFTIDDIHSGQVHQVFFEALKNHSCCISGADPWALEEICITSELNELPPFIWVSGEDHLCDMINTGLLWNEAKKNYSLLSDYVEKYLSRARLGGIYVKKLMKLLKC